jgi:hypothetical protein
MLKKSVLPLIIALLSATAATQDKIHNFSCSWVPQHILEHGMRIDFDLRLKKSSSWLVIAPRVYLDHRYAGPYNDEKGIFENDEEYYYEKMYCYGVELQHRIYLKNIDIPEGLYFSYSLNYMHFNIDYTEYGWGTVNYDDDLEAITYGLLDYNTSVDKFGPNIMFGYQMILTDRFFVDLHIGGGLKYSIIDASEYSTRNFDEHITSFGYTGALPVFVLRFGMIF